MPEAVIVEAVRTPISRGKAIVGDLHGFHAVDLLGLTLNGLIERSGIDYSDVDYLAGGCVTQAGEQAGNITRNAWLSLGKDYTAGGTTFDNQCGSAQTANHAIAAMIETARINIGIGCGVEAMSRVGLGQNVYNGPGYFQPPVWPWDTAPDQFTMVERIAKNRNITRQMVDEFALSSQQKAQVAWDEGRFASQVLDVNAPTFADDGSPSGETKLVNRDQGMRATTIEGLANLKPIIEGGIHTAGNASQISDGSAAVLWMTVDEAKKRGLKPRARIITDCTVGTDPYYLLDGPVDATTQMFKTSGMTMNDIDLFEINEAFAAVVLSWAQVFDADMSKVNVNGGAIALGHPVGSTGARLICTALHELERQDKSTALISMCCGSSIGTGTIIERI